MSLTVIIYLVAIAILIVIGSVAMMLYHTIFNKSSINIFVAAVTMGILLFSLFLYWM